MPVSQEYLDYILDQLRSFGSVTAKRMFGGAGLYHRGLFFGLAADDAIYLKVDDSNRQEYLDAGSAPFRPFGSYVMGYFEVPADVLEDPDVLASWARKAFAAASRSSAGGTRKGRVRQARTKKQ
jgi:DNA transformation protein